MPQKGCPVCGYPEFTELRPDGGSTYDLCPCCSFESGVDGIGWDREERNTTFRRRWLEGGGLWWSTARAPGAGWNVSDQLRTAGLAESDPDDDDHAPG